MRSRIRPFPELGKDQALAADPQVHAALSASAGTGKTQVLTARVLRLLLGGTRPETILCLTFTKAGAAEMANRIGARLAAWVRMRDADLRKDLINLGERNDPERLERARRLFARVLDAPGGLRIQTIHSFAQTLLASFPAEAGITPGFKPIERRAEQELARRTLADLLADAEARGERQLILDVQCLSLRLGEGDAVGYLMRCASRSEALEKLGPRETIEPAVRRLLDLPEGDIDQYLAERCGDESFDCDLLKAVADTNRQWKGVTGAGHVERIGRWLDLPPDERARQLPQLALVVFTGAGDPRKVTTGQSASSSRCSAGLNSSATFRPVCAPARPSPPPTPAPSAAPESPISTI
jgi:ATP-dependent helicase/nuclease subunit A